MSHFQVGAHVRMVEHNQPYSHEAANGALRGVIIETHPPIYGNKVWKVRWNFKLIWPEGDPHVSAHYEHTLVLVPDESSFEGRVLSYLDREFRNA